MPDADVEQDPMFPLLTDALRAGPGSPEWHQAVAKVRAAGLAEADEYRLLVAAREHLASGRDYRSIRAGAGFTRKVMAAVEQERQQQAGGRRPRGPSLASVLAALSVLVVVGVLAYLAYQFVFKAPAAQVTAEELAEVYFPRADVAAAFDAGGIPKDWRVVGSLPLEAGKGGLRPAAAPPGGDAATRPAAASAAATAPGETAGGAVVAPITVHPEEAFAVEVKLKPGRPVDDLIVQVFVSSEGDFSPDKSTSSKELAWLLQGGRQKVVLGGEADSRVLFDGPRPDAGATPAAGGGGGTAKSDPITVRVNVNRDYAVAFAGGPRVWAGPNGLAVKPRFVGVRFLRVDPAKPLVDPPTVQSIRLLRK